MSGLLDTSVIVRYLTGDEAELAARAAAIIDGEETLIVSDVALMETAYVLTSLYDLDRAMVVDHLVALVQRHNIVTLDHDKGTVLQALLMCRPSRRVSFADAFIWAAAHRGPVNVIYTFDRRFPTEGVELRP